MQQNLLKRNGQRRRNRWPSTYTWLLPTTLRSSFVTLGITGPKNPSPTGREHERQPVSGWPSLPPEQRAWYRRGRPVYVNGVWTFALDVFAYPRCSTACGPPPEE